MSLMTMFTLRRVRKTFPDTNIYPIDDVGGDVPLYAYGVVKLRKNYSGPALRIIRALDNAEMDIGFVGNKLDMGAVAEFLGTGVKGKVVRLYDQSGNGNNTDIQTDDAKRLEINMPLKINGESSVNGHPPLWGANFTYELPATLSCSSRDLSAYAVITGGIGNDAIVELGTGTNKVSQFYSPGAFIGYIYNTNKIFAVENPSVVELHLSSTNRIDMQGDQVNTSSALANMTLSGGRIGNITIAGGYLGTYHGLAWMAYGRALTTEERDTLKTSLNTIFAMNTEPGRVVFVGDSITAGYSNIVGYDSAGRFGYAYQSIPLLSKKVLVHNAGLHGGQLVNYVADYATKSGPFLAEYADNRVVFLMMGTNDLTVGGRTAAQIYADYQTYAANVRASGAKIIVATILPNDAWDATKQTTRNDLNTLIRDNWASFADGFCDFAADPTMGPQSAASDNTLYPDGLHPSELGHSYLAPLAATAINSLL
jgi:lysophospholipase L1-like esterase